MKKTLIALAVAASAAVSGSAMAWTESGTGGTVELGGTLTPETVVTPWETKIGNGISNLTAQLESGQTAVSITLPENVLVLGIRSTMDFTGQDSGSGLIPQIDFGDAVDLSSYNSQGAATLSLTVNNDADEKIGSLSTKITTAGEATRVNNNQYTSLFAGSPGHAYYGGLPDASGSVIDAYDLANRFDSSIVDTYNRGATSAGISVMNFSNKEMTFSSIYAAGLLTSDTVDITLDSAPTADVNWNAKLPVTVSYY